MEPQKPKFAPQLNRRQRNRPEMHVGGAKVALPASGASKMRIERPQRSGRRVQGAAPGVVQGGLACHNMLDFEWPQKFQATATKKMRTASAVRIMILGALLAA